MMGQAVRSALFPYTTLFRSQGPRDASSVLFKLLGPLEITAGGHLVELRAPKQRSEEHTSELQSHVNLVCLLPLEKKNTHSTSVMMVAKAGRATSSTSVIVRL